MAVGVFVTGAETAQPHIRIAVSNDVSILIFLLHNLGDKWRIFIPVELGFGKRGSPPRIGPNETLIFEVEMLDVISKD